MERLRLDDAHGLCLAATIDDAPTAGPTLAWMWVLAQGSIRTPDGRVFDLDADTTDVAAREVRWEDAKASLAEWFAGPSTRPQLLRVHRDQGHSYGAATGEVRFMTGREAIARGVPAEAVPASALDRESMFAQVEITDPETAQQWERGQIRTTSPSLFIGFQSDAHAEDGRVWPVVVLELSITGNPVQKSNQIPADSLRGVSLAVDSSAPTNKEESVEHGPTEVAGADMDDRIAKLEDGLSSVVEMLTAVSARVDEVAAMVAPEEADMAEHDEEKAEMSRRIAELEAANAELSERAARQSAAATLSEYSLSDDQRTRGVDLAVKSPEAFALFVETLPKPERTTEALDVGNGPAPDVSTSVDLSSDDGRKAVANLAASIQREARKAGRRMTRSEATKQALANLTH